MPNVDINGTVVSFPDDMQPDQLKSAVAAAASKIGGQKSFLGITKANLPQTISSVARPMLEMGGAAGGGALGFASPIPGGTAIGGAAGFGAGKAGADLLDRALGVKQPLKNIGQAAQETGQDVLQGVQNEAAGLAGGPVLNALKKPAGRFAGNLGRIISGVDEKSGERLFQDPGAFLSPTMKQAGKKLGDIRSSLGINTRRFSAENALSPESSASRKFATDLFNRMQGGEKPPLADLVKGSQAMDDIIQLTPMWQRSKRAELFDLKKSITDQLQNVIPEERAAAKEFSRSALAGDFRKVFPVTKRGDVSVTRTAGLGLFSGGAGELMPAALAKVAPAILAQSPFLSGAGIAAGGAGYKALQNPTVRRSVIAALRALRDKNENSNP